MKFSINLFYYNIIDLRIKISWFHVFRGQDFQVLTFSLTRFWRNNFPQSLPLCILILTHNIDPSLQEIGALEMECLQRSFFVDGSQYHRQIL